MVAYNSFVLIAGCCFPYNRYVEVADPQELARTQQSLCESLLLKGRVRVSKEGLNGTLGAWKTRYKSV